MIEFILAFIAWLVVVLLISRMMRINGRDNDAQQAADSVRQALDFEELRTYTRPHVRGNTAYGKEVK
jgi:hypothetical protein